VLRSGNFPAGARLLLEVTFSDHGYPVYYRSKAPLLRLSSMSDRNETLAACNINIEGDEGRADDWAG
jgi:hypothetical protein